MILPVTQGKRFFGLFNSLTIYAHRRLQVVSDSEFFGVSPLNPIDETAQRETIMELWKHPEILDDFVRDNPFNLPRRDLDVALTWKGCDIASYTVDTMTVGNTEALYFCTEGHAFVVWGLSKPIESMLTRIPGVVQTTLLPFEDKITYGMFIMEMPVEMGDNMRAVLRKDFEASVVDGCVVRTGAQFLEKMPLIRAQAEQRQLEQFRREMEMEERAQGPLPGQHRGALVGMDEDERERRVIEYIDNSISEGDRGKRIQQMLDSYCLPGDPVYTLEELLQRDRDRESDTRIATMIEANKTDDDFFRALVDPEVLQDDLGSFSEHELELLRELAAKGGRWHIPAAGLTTLKGVPRYIRGLCYHFHDADGYLTVMPKEIVAASQMVDWDEPLSYARRRREMLHFMELISELRGILTLDEAFAAYRTACPQGFETYLELFDILFESLDSLEFGGCVLETPDESYLMHFELFFDYLRSHGIRPGDSDAYFEGELDGLPEVVRKHQQGKEARALTKEMLASNSVFTWASKQPPTLAMRNYLDTHVPDDADDYFFAEKVVEDLLPEVFIGFFESGTQVFFDILENNGFIPDYSQVNKLLGLWQNMCNGLPNWPNNGWSPNELHNRSSKRMIFYNEDGSPMRIGRNDPCPCGSGKKYKRCCGR